MGTALLRANLFKYHLHVTDVSFYSWNYGNRLKEILWCERVSQQRCQAECLGRTVVCTEKLSLAAGNFLE